MKTLVFSLLALFLATMPLRAEDAGALIIDVLGQIEPDFGAFEDVPVGTTLTLADDTELTISHYKACEEITVRGGTVGIGASGLALHGGEVTDRVPVDCPTTVALAARDTASATVVVRNVIELAKVPLSPVILLVGDNASGFDELIVSRDGNLVAELAIRDSVVIWPASGLYLSDRTSYELLLRGSAGEFSATVVADRRTNSRVVLRP